MRGKIIALLLACGAVTSVAAQVSVSIGFNVPAYPQLVRVPSYPVYYAPDLGENYFFYDGAYWVYQSDNWYASSWYNGPWSLVEPESVPLFVLRVPVRYYRAPPSFFGGWRDDAPPRWGEHWGGGWEQQHGGWDRWNRNAVPPPAPLPVYQRNYSGNRYPRVEEQHALQGQNYRYKPQDLVVRQHIEENAARRAALPVAGDPIVRQHIQENTARRTVPAPPVSPPDAVVRQHIQENAARRAAPPFAGDPVVRQHIQENAARRAVPAAPPQAERAPARSEPPAARQTPRGPEPAAPAAQERQAHGQGQDKDRGDGRGQDRKN